MAEAAIGSSIKVVLQTVISLAGERIGLFFGFNEELESLRDSATMIQAVLADAEAKQGHDKQVKLWLKRLERVAFGADDVFDELKYEILRRQVRSRNQQQLLKGKLKRIEDWSFSIIMGWNSKKLASLERLWLWNSKKLLDAIKFVTKLPSPGIWDSSLLEKRCDPLHQRRVALDFTHSKPMYLIKLPSL